MPSDANRKFFPRSILALLGLTAGLAFWTRHEFIIANGGLQPDYIAWATKYYFGGITPYYLRDADNLLHLRALTSTTYPPGYPAFIALWKAVGVRGLQQLREVQAVLDSLTVFPLYYVLRRMGAVASPALLACGVYAVAPLWAFGAGFILAEALAPLLFVAMLTGMWLARDRDGGAGWAALGAAGAMTGMIRPDLLVLAVPIAGWAFCVSARRHVSAALVLVGFALPVLLWGAYNRVENGHWVFASTSGVYSLWAGLGQLPNDYGYFVSDARAGELLKSHGLEDHTPAAEAFWGAAYRAAWREHPNYVLRTLEWRLSRIPFDQHSYNAPADYCAKLDAYFTKYGPLVALAAVLVLLALRRYAAAFMVALPLAYAELTLGLLYYESRYIRYVPLSYVFAAAMLLSLAWQALAPRIPPRRLGIAAGAASLLLFGWALRGSIPSMKVLAREAHRESLGIEVQRAWDAGQRTLLASLPDLQPRWIKQVPGVAYALQPDGLHLTTDAYRFHYEIAAPIPTAGYAGLALTYDVQVQDGGATVSFLAGDGGSFLSQDNLRTPGDYHGALTCAVTGMPSADVLVSNFRIANGVSHLLIRDLKVYGVKL